MEARMKNATGGERQLWEQNKRSSDIYFFRKSGKKYVKSMLKPYVVSLLREKYTSLICKEESFNYDDYDDWNVHLPGSFFLSIEVVSTSEKKNGYIRGYKQRELKHVKGREAKRSRSCHDGQKMEMRNKARRRKK